MEINDFLIKKYNMKKKNQGIINKKKYLIITKQQKEENCIKTHTLNQKPKEEK